VLEFAPSRRQTKLLNHLAYRIISRN